jgi:hypothetical protein
MCNGIMWSEWAMSESHVLWYRNTIPTTSQKLTDDGLPGPTWVEYWSESQICRILPIATKLYKLLKKAVLLVVTPYVLRTDVSEERIATIIRLRWLGVLGTMLNNSDFWDVTQCGFVRTDISEERSNSIIRVIRIGVLGRTLGITSYRRTLRRNTM